MISKELLSEVLVLNIVCVSNFLRKDNMLEYQFLSSRNKEYGHNNVVDEIIYPPRQINIYELAHKCKEWIINKGYVLKLCYVLKNDTRELCFIETTLLRSDQYSSDYYDIDSKTEVEAVIKACEWILNSKDSK